jgi:tRNA threonylcarbamoyladenosine biosynthesis protein TsaE
METIDIVSLHQLKSAAKAFLALTQGYKKFAFYGAMGSGKTTLIKAICNQLGAVDAVTSPTFSLVNEYRIPGGESLFHFDLYRINSLEELFDLGYEEYFFGDSYLFIEWAEKAESLIPDRCLKVYIEEKDSMARQVRIVL